MRVVSSTHDDPLNAITVPKPRCVLRFPLRHAAIAFAAMIYNDGSVSSCGAAAGEGSVRRARPHGARVPLRHTESQRGEIAISLRSAISRCSFRAVGRETVPLQQAIQAASIDAQRSGGSGLIAALTAQDFDHVRTFD
jgi:hypothetical protein